MPFRRSPKLSYSPTIGGWAAQNNTFQRGGTRLAAWPIAASAVRVPRPGRSREGVAMSSRRPVFVLAFTVLSLSIVVAGCKQAGARNESPTPPARGVEAGKSGVGTCSAVPSADDLRRLVKQAPTLVDPGGLGHGHNQW